MFTSQHKLGNMLIRNLMSIFTEQKIIWSRLLILIISIAIVFTFIYSFAPPVRAAPWWDDCNCSEDDPNYSYNKFEINDDGSISGSEVGDPPGEVISLTFVGLVDGEYKYNYSNTSTDWSLYRIYEKTGHTSDDATDGPPQSGTIYTEDDISHITFCLEKVSFNPSIDIEKIPDSQQVVSGSDVSFTITVTNTGDVELTNVTVTDANAPDCANSFASLASGANESYTCTGSPPVGSNVTATDTADVDVINPSIDIEKIPDSQQVVSGSDVSFTITVTNTGDVELTDVTVTDAKAPDCANSFASLASGANESYTCTVANVTEDFTNSATATGSPPVGTDVTDTDDAVVDALPTITVTKAADPTELPEPGGSVTFTVSVTNNSVETVTLDSLTDDVHGDLNGQGTCATEGTISAGSTYTCSFTADVTGDGGYSETDTVEATVSDDEGNSVSGSDGATVTILAVADLELVKDVDNSEPAEGDTIIYTIEVTNRGPSNATGVEITDVLPRGVTYVSHDGFDYSPGRGVWDIGNLAVGAYATLKITATVDTGTANSTITNTAEVTAI